MRLTVCIRYDAGLFKAGGEVQALATVRALEGLGIDVRLHEPLNEDMGDLVHFFGTMDYFWEVAEALDRMGTPYVCSPIFVTTRTGGKLRTRRLRHQIRGAYPRGLRNLFRGAKRLFPLSRLEEQNLSDYFGPLPPCRRVPNGVEEPFYRASGELFRSSQGVEGPYLLHVGSYTPRKNQLAVIEAARGLSLRRVFIGQAHDRDYLAACKAAAEPGTVFLEDIPHEDPLLASAYAGAAAFCLPSKTEILSIASLEAAVAGASLVLSNTWGADEFFGEECRCVDPDSPKAIRKAIVWAMDRAYDRHAQRDMFWGRYQWPAIARTLIEEYEAVLAGR